MENRVRRTGKEYSENMANRLWYQRPAEYWEEALPVGNGRLGAMIYGRVDKEIIQLNEESLWSGEHIDRCNPDCYENLDTIRNYIKKGKINEAEQLAVLAMSGIPQSQRAYQTFGELYLQHLYQNAGKESHISCDRYERELDLDGGIVRTSWEIDETKYTQEVVASYPADVLIIHLEAHGAHKLNFRCHMERGRFYDHAAKSGEDSIYMDGNSGGIRFAGMLKATQCDGKVSTLGEHLVVTDANEVMLVFSAYTSFRVNCPYEAAKKSVDTQAMVPYATLKEEHRKDYQALFGRVTLQFGKSKDEENLCLLPTDERILRMQKNESDPGLIELYFQYGRYLLISGSRPGSLPLTLQGIWNEDITPPWDSKYTVNINLQMNYWPAEICGLVECAEPFFSHLKKMVESGRITAKKMYGCHGFVVHHNTDIFADTAPQDHYIPASYWVMGGAWLSTHIWNHYLFTKDTRFLKEYFEILTEAVLFFKDFLIEDKNGNLVTTPSVSPENTYIMADGSKGCMCDAPTMDNEILYHLFHDYLSSAQELKIQDDLKQEVEKMLEKLPKLRIGSYGQLMEWKEDYTEAEPGHRHISHLYGVFPGQQITVEDNPVYAKAARISLEHRLENGGGHTGWSRAWILLLWDRFKDGAKAYQNLQALIGHSTFPNMMDFHPLEGYKRGKAFQIDGNMGGITGIAEMLVQSHSGRVELLPALPLELNSGSVKGLRVRGGASLSMDWKHGELTKAVIESQNDMEIRLVYRALEKRVKLSKNNTYQFNGSLEVEKVIGS